MVLPPPLRRKIARERGLITKTYETAEAISSLSVSDKYADVTVKADDVDHVVVEYSYNSSYNDAFGTGGELYSFTIAGPSLNIQGLKGDASMSVNNSKCICTMTVKLPAGRLQASRWIPATAISPSRI